MNTVRLSGTLQGVLNVSLKAGVAQYARLWYDTPHGHSIGVWAPPDVRVALCEGDMITLEGHLCGDHIVVEGATA